MECWEFKRNIKHANGPRVYKVTGSYGVYDAYKYYRKNKPKDKKFILTESQYFSIIRKVNNLLVEQLLSGEDIVFPCRLGKIEVRKYPVIITREGDKIKTNLPIDWDKTLQLWYEDKESHNNKQLVYIPETEMFRIKYCKVTANYQFKSFYQFTPNRNMKLSLKKLIKNKQFDAFI